MYYIYHISYDFICYYKMIVIYTESLKWSKFFHLLLKKLEQQYKCVIINKPNNYYFKKADVIIPLGINCQKILNKYTKFNNKFFVSNTKTYNILNDKKLFYDFIKKNNFLENSEIQLIKSYNRNYNGKNIYGEYIIKHVAGVGSGYNEIVKDYIYNIIDKKSTNYQIQDIINIKFVHCLDFLVKNGKIISYLNFIVDGKIDEEFYDNNNKQQIIKINNEKFLKVAEKIFYKTNYNGFCEIEFIEDFYNNFYIMECNPRISGNINCYDINDNCPFIDNFINPYINIIKNKKYKLPNYKNNKQVAYIGKVKYNKYYSCDCGCGKVIQ